MFATSQEPESLFDLVSIENVCLEWFDDALFDVFLQQICENLKMCKAVSCSICAF